MKQKTCFIALLSLAVLLVGCLWGPGKTGTLLVRIYEGPSEDLFYGEAILELTGKDLIVVEGGQHLFIDVKAGKRHLTVRTEDFEPHENVEVMIHADQENEVTIRLSPSETEDSVFAQDIIEALGHYTGRKTYTQAQAVNLLPTLKSLIAKQTFNGVAGYNDGRKMTVALAQSFIEHFVRNTGSYVKRRNARAPGEPDWYWNGTDNKYSSIPFRGSRGCMHYANFVAAVMHKGLGGTSGNYYGEGKKLYYEKESKGRFTAAGIKAFLLENAQAGEHIRLPEQPHSYVYIGATDTEFFTLEYDGGNNAPYLSSHPFQAFTNYLNNSKHGMYIANASTAKNSGTPAAPKAPVITSHPQSQTVRENETFTFGVNASSPDGGVLSYQWELHNGERWLNTGKTTANYSARASLDVSGYLFRCAVRNTLNGQTSAPVYSTQAKLTVTKVGPKAPVITSHPQSQTVRENETFTFGVNASSPDGGMLSYQWELHNGERWLNTGKTTANYSARASLDASGYLFRCAVRNISNGQISEPVYSAYAKLTVIRIGPQTPVITSHPKSQTVRENEMFTFEVNASSPDGGVLSYQWEVHNGERWIDANNTTAEFSATASLDLSGSVYRCAVRNTLDGQTSEPVYSLSARLTVEEVTAVPEIIFVNPTENNDRFNPLTINSGSMILIELKGDLSEVEDVLISVDDELGGIFRPENKMSGLLAENLGTGSHTLSVTLYDVYEEIITSRSIEFYWENYRDGFGAGRFNFHDH